MREVQLHFFSSENKFAFSQQTNKSGSSVERDTVREREWVREGERTMEMGRDKERERERVNEVDVKVD